MVQLHLSLFGAFEMRLNGQLLPPLRSRKTSHLLALLALRQGREVQRDFLAGTLWPESAQAQSYYNLRRSLVDLRHGLGTQSERIVSPTLQTLRLDLQDAVVDVAAFDAAILRGDRNGLLEAVALYRGPLLEEYAEEWVFAEREARHDRYLAALETLADQAQAEGNYHAAARGFRQIIAADPYRESAHRRLMRALANGGDYLSAILVYRDLRLLLHSEFATEPAHETRALLRQIREEATQRQALTRVATAFRAPEPRSDDEAFALAAEELALAHNDTAHDNTEEIDIEADMAINKADGETAGETVTGTVLMPRRARPESADGPAPLDSPYYISRPVDHDFNTALSERDSIVLIKGARQMGKTSLLARGLQQTRDSGARVVLSDFGGFSAAQLVSTETLLSALAADLADQLELDVLPKAVWSDQFGSNRNLERYLRREALGAFAGPLVWAMDEADRLFPYDYASDVFGLFRSWHNRRSLDPAGPWSRLTLVLAYATEAHLFITDINQSPFNVGTRLALDDFTVEQVAELNRRYALPLRNEAEVNRYHALLNGHPYLVRQGMAQLVGHNMSLQELERRADGNDGPFAEHLRRLLTLLLRDDDLAAVVRSILSSAPCMTDESFYRLRSAGILTGESAHTPQLRCPLYRTFLMRHML